MPALSILIKLENFVFFSHHPHPYPYMYIYIQKYIRYFTSKRKRKAAFDSGSFRNDVKSKEKKAKLMQIMSNTLSRLRSPPLSHSLTRWKTKKQMRARGRAFLAISRLRLLIRFYCTWNEQLNRGISGPFNRAAIFIAYPWRGDPYQSSRVVFAVYPENA